MSVCRCRLCASEVLPSGSAHVEGVSSRVGGGDTVEWTRRCTEYIAYTAHLVVVDTVGMDRAVHRALGNEGPATREGKCFARTARDSRHEKEDRKDGPADRHPATNFVHPVAHGNCHHQDPQPRAHRHSSKQEAFERSGCKMQLFRAADWFEPRLHRSTSTSAGAVTARHHSRSKTRAVRGRMCGVPAQRSFSASRSCGQRFEGLPLSSCTRICACSISESSRHHGSSSVMPIERGCTP